MSEKNVHKSVSVELRAAKAIDFEFAWHLYRDLLIDLTDELIGWNEDNQRNTVKQDFSSNDTKIIIAGREPIGWLAICEDDSSLYLHQLLIVREMQNRGIGSQIIRDLLWEAQRRSKTVRLAVMRNNIGARRLYERLGFSVYETDERKHYLAAEQ